MNNIYKGQLIEIRAMLQIDHKQIEQDLSPTQIEAIKNWCIQFYPIQSINYDHSSYKLKHLCESNLGFYVPNGIVKQIMNELGYNMVDKDSPNGINEYYNVSKASVKNRT